MPDKTELTSFFDDCRRKRNRLSYEAPNEATEQEAETLLEQAKTFYFDVMAWLAENHPDFAPAAPEEGTSSEPAPETCEEE